MISVQSFLKVQKVLAKLTAMTLQDQLPSLNREFIAYFGEIGSKWGINRTVGQIYALLYISTQALNADEIAETLAVSRSNVSMGLKELQAWRLVRLRRQRPTITIALCWFLVFFRVRFARTRDTAWEEAFCFWTKVFAPTFALGVVSGIVMGCQFGTNWPGFMERTGNISGPLLGHEVLTAFFLEASFLDIMLFGRGRVSERVHLTATALVAFGTTMSAFWILSLNSWMHTPAGFEIVNEQFIPTDWLAVIFNPSLPYRLAHVLLASALTASFLIAGLSAWQLLKGSATRGTHKALRAGVFTAAAVMPMQFLAGDMHGLNTLEHQPAKVAAMEGIWDTVRGAPLTLFGIPDKKERTTHFAIEIPKLASLVLTHDLDGAIKGLNGFKGSHPLWRPCSTPSA